MYGTFTLTGRHTTPSGKAHAGQVVISPNTTIRDVDGDVVMSGAERVALDETGAWSIVLPCDSPGLNPPEGLGYRIGYALHSVSELPQSFYATADLAGSTLDVSDIVTVSVPAPLSAIVGPQGEPGPAGSPVDSAAFVDSHVGPTLAAPDGVDATADLATFLSAATPLGVKRLIGSFQLSAKVTIPPGVYVDATRATFTQTSDTTTTLEMQAGSTLVGATLIGKATDYVAGLTNTTACGVRVVGAGVTITGCTVRNHSGAGIYAATGASYLTVENTEVSAPDLTIPPNDSSCFGVYINVGATSPTLRGLHVHDVSIGIITSVDSARTIVQNCRIHDIKGQHALYLQNAVSLHVENVAINTVALNGVKVQMFASNAEDGTGAVIANVTVDGAGDVGVTLNNTDAALTRKYRALTLSNVAVSNSLRGFYLGSVRTATLQNLVAYNCSSDGLTLLDCWDVNATVNLDTTGRVGARITSVTNGSNQRITLGGLIRNPAAGNVASNIYGVYIADATDLTLDGLKVSATNGFMQYGVFFAGGDQKSFTMRRCDLSGSTGTDVRLLAGPVRVKEWSNNSLAGSVLNFPTGYATRVGSKGLTSQYVINALPTADVFRVGDELLNGAPAVGSPKSWICTTAGGAHGGTWAATTAYALGDWRRNASGRVYECTTAGTSGATGPVGTTVGATETDGTVVWTCRALAPAVFTSTGNL